MFPGRRPAGGAQQKQQQQQQLLDSNRNDGDWWRPLVPLAGLGLIAFVLGSYAVAIRQVAAARWCSAVPVVGEVDGDDGAAAAQEEDAGRSHHHHSFLRWWPPSSSCQAWMPLNDLAVTYLGTMILFHYLCTVFRSPGVVVAAAAAAAKCGKDPTITTVRHHHQESNCHQRHYNDEERSSELKFSAWESQGGLLCCDPVADLDAEERRVRLYGPLTERPIVRSKDDDDNNNNNPSLLPSAPPPSSSDGAKATTTAVVLYVPSPHPSYCDICRHVRPPRSHHCSTCHRCVLQYDHHCLWVNQCIGYNNLGHFLGMVGFLLAGCLYGTMLLWRLHYRTAWQQWWLLLRHHREEEGADGIRSLAIGAAGRMVRCELVRRLVFRRDGDGPAPPEAYMDLVFPILLGVEVLLAHLGGGHALRLCRAATALESKLMRRQLGRINRRNRTTTAEVVAVAVVNPFDQGVVRNLFQVFGPRPLLWLLPVLQSPVPPFLPPPLADKDR